jgi:hypothetical protein
MDYEFPECNSFGTVIRFGLELERAAMNIYDELSRDAKLAAGAETFKALSVVHKKRGDLLEYTRREKLNEMILEPIQDLDAKKYIIDTKVPKGVDIKAAARYVAGMEEKSSMFYFDSSQVAKNLLSEGARILEKMAKENIANKAKVEAL